MATTPEEVWQLLGELVQSQRETDRKLREFSEAAAQRSQEIDRRLKESGEETDRKLREFSEAAAQRSQ
ncbi:MAG: hypothetical protein ACO4AI_15125, partial [Prochlorothrix sp.]